MMCQRYYQAGYYIWGGDISSATTYYGAIPVFAEFRSEPTTIYTDISRNGFGAATASLSGYKNAIRFLATAGSTTSGGFYELNWKATAEL
jgi:hypothetical protein